MNKMETYISKSRLKFLKVITNISLVIVFLACVSADTHAQIVAQIGTAGDTSQISGYSPINRASATTTLQYSRANFVILSSELTSAGIPVGAVITKLSFFKGYNGTNANTGQFGIYMNNSTVAPPLSTTTTWASILASHTQVYSNPTQSLPHEVIGWVDFTLTTPFTWTGSNIEIADFRI